MMTVCLLLTGCSQDEISVYGGIYGTIRDAVTGAPIYNAEITLSPGNRTTVSGNDGSYEYQNMDAGQYSLSVDAAGYQYNSRTVSVVAGESTLCDMRLYPESPMSGVEVSATSLNFDTTYSELTFEIRNTGTSGPVEWSITGIDAAWLTVNPMSGTTDMGKSSSVKVSVDRSLITENTSALFTVNAAGGSKSIMVSVRTNSGNDNNNGGGGNNNNTAQDVTNGLYAYYMFEGDFQNSVDGAPNGQGINNPTFTNGLKSSQAVKLSVADNSFLNIPEAMIDSETFSISFWIKGLSDGHLFHVPSHYNYENGYILTMQNGILTFWSGRYWYYKSYNEVKPFTHPTIDASQWNMIALTFSPRSNYSREVLAKLYINGDFIDVVAITLDCVNYGTKFVFGGKFEDTTPPSMTIDNLRVYNSRAISDAEVKQIYNYEK